MYSLEVFTARALVKCVLAGQVGVDELRSFSRDVLEALAPGGGIDKVLADIREFKPAAPQVAELVDQWENRAAEGARVAEIVENQVIAVQLNQVADEQGRGESLQRFADEKAALAWLQG